MEDDIINLVMKRFKPAFFRICEGYCGFKSKRFGCADYLLLVRGPGAADLGSQVCSNCPESEGGRPHSHPSNDQLKGKARARTI